MNQHVSHDASEEVKEVKDMKSQPNKMPFVEPTVSTPEDVLEATSFFQAPTVDISTV